MAVEKKNIFLKNTIESMPYKSLSRRIGTNYPTRQVDVHAMIIERKLNECYEKSLTPKQAAAIRYKGGMYLEFSGMKGYDLAIKSLENRKAGIHLSNVREDPETNIVRATVYIPAGKENYFIKKVEAYANEFTKNGNPKNDALVGSIEDVKLAMVESFWVGKLDTMPSEQAVWCEVWLRFDYSAHYSEPWKQAEENIDSICKKNGIRIDKKNIIFPERIVKLIYANAEELKILISICPFIAEFRRAQEANAFFRNLSNKEQKKWTDELLSRTTYQNNDIAICLLDTGVTETHPLLNPAIDINHMQSINSSWGNGDNHGHGTEMAGIALFNDLKQLLESQRQIVISHEIESVKILPQSGCNPPELYGAITKQAVALAEIANPKAKRIICMAITSPEFNTMDGSPTSWSAAIDNIVSGAEEENVKRLFLISAGNVYPYEFQDSTYPNANILHCIESPGQSWNAITVGAYADGVEIVDSDFKGYLPLAEFGALSPYSSTSGSWNSKWPVKPEVLFNGGNIATNGSDYSECPDLSLLTTYYKPWVKQFSTIEATSSATAQAAWFCAQLLNEYPDMWSETVRALMIHSASWTSKMKEQFCLEDSKTKGRKSLLRSCGYGIPNLQKAIRCLNNSVNMIIQGELQPYSKNSMNEMHIHTLPWPKEVLRSLGEIPVTLKVTLSYFVEPGPGEVGWKDKYRYPSCGLRFDLKNSDETIDDFKKRVNVKMRGEDIKDKGDGSSGSERWYLGSDNRDVGSIHSDFCEINAVDLCDCNNIAVYPIIGWWRERTYLGKYNKKVRYSLVVSLSTPKEDIDLYTPIMTQVMPTIEVSV